MADGDIVYCLFSPLNFVIGEPGNDPVVDASDHSFVNGNAREKAHDTFGGGHDVGTVGFPVSVPLIGIDLYPVFPDTDLTDVGLFLSDICFHIHCVHIITPHVYTFHPTTLYCSLI